MLGGRSYLSRSAPTCIRYPMDVVEGIPAHKGSSTGTSVDWSPSLAAADRDGSRQRRFDDDLLDSPLRVRVSLKSSSSSCFGRQTSCRRRRGGGVTGNVSEGHCLRRWPVTTWSFRLISLRTHLHHSSGLPGRSLLLAGRPFYRVDVGPTIVISRPHPPVRLSKSTRRGSPVL